MHDKRNKYSLFNSGLKPALFRGFCIFLFLLVKTNGNKMHDKRNKYSLFNSGLKPALLKCIYSVYPAWPSALADDVKANIHKQN